MPLYVYSCPCGHTEERLRPIVDRNKSFVCQMCVDCEACRDLTPSDTPLYMTRSGIELQKRPRVVSGKRIHHRYEAHYTRGLP